MSGNYFYAREGTNRSMFKRNVTLVETAITPATAETFTTNSGKLITDESGQSWPSYDSTPLVQITPGQDWQVVIVRNDIDSASDKINSDGNYTVKIYRADTGTVPTGGTYKFSIELTEAE